MKIGRRSGEETALRSDWTLGRPVRASGAGPERPVMWTGASGRYGVARETSCMDRTLRLGASGRLDRRVRSIRPERPVEGDQARRLRTVGRQRLDLKTANQAKTRGTTGRVRSFRPVRPVSAFSAGFVPNGSIRLGVYK